MDGVARPAAMAPDCAPRSAGCGVAPAPSTATIPRKRRSSRSAPVMIRFCAPQTRIKSLSMTSSSGRARATFMRPMTSPSFVCISRTMIGRCQYLVGIVVELIEQRVTQEMMGVQERIPARRPRSVTMTHFLPEASTRLGERIAGVVIEFGQDASACSPAAG